MFTKEQTDEIKETLAISGAKDSQFPTADLPMSGEETLAILQQGENKKIPISTFYDEFSRYIDKSERVDLLNVSRYAQQVYQSENVVSLTLQEAIAICPNDVRRGGQIITFLDKNTGMWVKWQYQGTTNANWSNIEYWSPETAAIVSVTSDGIATDSTGKRWQLTRFVETYVTPTANWTYDGITKALATTNQEYVIYWANTPEALVSSTDTTIPTAKNAGTYTYYWKVKDAGDEPGSTGSITITVSKRTITFVSQGNTKSYDGTNVTASTEVTITNSIEGEEFEATAVGTAGPNAGAYSNTITLTTTPLDYLTNYNINKQEGSLLINRASRTLSWTTAPTTPIVEGTTITCVASVNKGDGQIIYHFGSTTNTTGTYTATIVGNLQVYASIPQTANYQAAQTSAVTIRVNELPSLYAISRDGTAPVPTTISDLINPDAKYTMTGTFANEDHINCSTTDTKYKMSWFAVPAYKSLRIYSADGGEDLTGKYVSTGVSPTIINNYNVYIQVANVGSWSQYELRLVIS